MSDISFLFLWLSNWRSIWNINSVLSPDPQSVMPGGNIVSLGPLYKVMPGDSIGSIAGVLCMCVCMYVCILEETLCH